jgi:hypothetical protein
MTEGGSWCPDEYRERLNQLLDERQFNFHSYDFIESEAEGLCRLCQLVEMLAETYLKMGNVCCPLCAHAGVSTIPNTIVPKQSSFSLVK